jgi:UDP-galactopyranose mutase
VYQFTSGVDVKHFARSRALAEAADPADQAPIPRPRLGWFGVVDERMDLTLVDAVAERRPDWHLVMIGPVVKIDMASLPRRPNIHWIGAKKMPELPSYLSGWDVGFVPFAINEHTRYISPTKTPEYLAAGVPVVCTPITDVVRDWGDEGYVAIARDADEVIAASEAFMAKPRDAWWKSADARLAKCSWDSIWSAMERLIRGVAAKADGTPASTTAVAGSTHV